MTSQFLIFFYSLSLCFFCSNYIYGEDFTVSMGQATSKKSTLKIDYKFDSQVQLTEQTLINSLKKQLIQNLEVSQLFEYSDVDPNPTFHATITLSKKQNQYTFNTKTLHLITQKVLLEKEYSSQANNSLQLVHNYTDDLIKNLTGAKGIFSSKFVASYKAPGSKVKEIVLFDWNGLNQKQISFHKSLSLSPTWSPGGNQIAYTSYTAKQNSPDRNPNLLIYNAQTKKRFLVSQRKGLNSGADFGFKGQSLWMTLSLGKNPDIFNIGLNGSILKRLTKGPLGALNIEPSLSPDGTQVAYSSNKGGNPMIYIHNLKTDKFKRITFAGQYNSTPAWSPDGKWLSFAGQDKSHFDIFIVNTNGSQMSRLTSAKKPSGSWADNEDPSYSPDGRYIAYSSDRTGRKQIYFSPIDGSIDYKVSKRAGAYFQPEWSPYLK